VLLVLEYCVFLLDFTNSRLKKEIVEKIFVQEYATDNDC
jgi:hypothetical protein